MMFYVYAIRDNAAESFSMPIYSRSDEEMIRNTAYSLQQGESMMKTYAEDYDLYRVGTFNDETGAITPCEHVLVVHLSSLLKEGV